MFDLLFDNLGMVIWTSMFIALMAYVMYVRHRDRTPKETPE